MTADLIAKLEAVLGDQTVAAKRMAEITAQPATETPELLSIYTEMVAMCGELTRAIAAIRARGEG